MDNDRIRRGRLASGPVVTDEEVKRRREERRLKNEFSEEWRRMFGPPIRGEKW